MNLQSSSGHRGASRHAVDRQASDGLDRRPLLVAADEVIAQTPTPAQQKNIEQAKAREAQAKALLAKYTASPGRDDSDGLLKEPAVSAELKRVVGNQLPKLMQNTNVRGSIAYDGGSLVVSGNAPHKGGEEEGVICVNPYSPGLVEAAIFSRGKITVFATAEKYEYLSLCVKDWITQVNSGHRDRTTQPKTFRWCVPSSGPVEALQHLLEFTMNLHRFIRRRVDPADRRRVDGRVARTAEAEGGVGVLEGAGVQVGLHEGARVRRPTRRGSPSATVRRPRTSSLPSPASATSGMRSARTMTAITTAQ